MNHLRSIDAEIDALYEQYQDSRVLVNWPASALRRKELEFEAALRYWLRQRQEAAVALVMLSEVPIQCKAATLSPTAFMNAGSDPQLK